jgi:hypothetical protein
MTKRVAAFCAALLSFVVFLIVALWGATFGIDGNTTRALLPGSTAPINVRISNPHFYPITVNNLTVRIASITPARTGAKCSPSNFTVRQADKFSVHLAAFSMVTLNDTSLSKSGWPSLHLTGVQSKLDDGCQGATITLAYAAKGSWWTK